MISRTELAKWAERFGVSPPQMARDHFISHVLLALRSLHSPARFFGGTALCRTYLEGSRLSEDVDLLHADPSAFLEDLAEDLPKALRREFPGTTCAPPASLEGGWATSLQPPDLPPIKLYVGHEGSDTRAWKFVETEVALRYSDLPRAARMSCPTLATFGAMKLAAWFDRHAPRDLFDLAGLAALGALNDPDVHQMFSTKMGHRLVEAEFGRIPRATAEAWETELGAQVGVLPSGDHCLAVVRDAVGLATN